MDFCDFEVWGGRREDGISSKENIPVDVVADLAPPPPPAPPPGVCGVDWSDSDSEDYDLLASGICIVQPVRYTSRNK